MATQQQDIRTLSVKYSKLETLINHVNYDSLKAEHRSQLKNKGKRQTIRSPLKITAD